MQTSATLGRQVEQDADFIRASLHAMQHALVRSMTPVAGELQKLDLEQVSRLKRFSFAHFGPGIVDDVCLLPFLIKSGNPKNPLCESLNPRETLCSLDSFKALEGADESTKIRNVLGALSGQAAEIKVSLKPCNINKPELVVIRDLLADLLLQLPLA